MKPLVPGKVTIGIPSRNRCALLMRAVNSALEQTYPLIQVLVSDDASDDGTAEALAMIADPRVRYIRQQERLGVVRNQNAVLRAAEGEFFLSCSDDDLLAPDAIRQMVRTFLHGCCGKPGSEFGLSWCPCEIINASDQLMYTTAAGPLCESSVDFMYGVYTGTRGPRYSGVLIRTQSALEVGGFDEVGRGPLCDTTNWGGAALKHRWAACIPSPLLKYTVHATTITSQAKCADWQRWGHAMLEGHVSQLRAQGDEAGARKLASAESTLQANLTADVLLRGRLNPGWYRQVVAELWRSRKFLLTFSTFKRALRDGWKVLRYPAR
jgi:hypothetical protein